STPDQGRRAARAEGIGSGRIVRAGSPYRAVPRETAFGIVPLGFGGPVGCAVVSLGSARRLLFATSKQAGDQEATRSPASRVRGHLWQKRNGNGLILEPDSNRRGGKTCRRRYRHDVGNRE